MRTSEELKETGVEHSYSEHPKDMVTKGLDSERERRGGQGGEGERTGCMRTHNHILLALDMSAYFNISKEELCPKVKKKKRNKLNKILYYKSFSKTTNKR